MECCAVQNNQRPARGISGLRPDCTATLVGFYIGDSKMSGIGHRYIGVNGYWYIKTAPCKYELEHRLIAAKKIGRSLRAKENTHHINGIKTDNRPENIEVFESNSAHISYHHVLYGKNHPMNSPKAVAKRILTRWTGKPIICRFETCIKAPHSRGLCRHHYYIENKKGNLDMYERLLKTYAYKLL